MIDPSYIEIDSAALLASGILFRAGSWKFRFYLTRISYKHILAIQGVAVIYSEWCLGIKMPYVSLRLVDIYTQVMDVFPPNNQPSPTNKQVPYFACVLISYLELGLVNQIPFTRQFCV